VEKGIRALGPGFFVIGLDYHTGFVVYDGVEVYFVHSDYLPDQEVVAEKFQASDAISSSRYHMVGKIFSHALIEKWLSGERIPTVLPGH